MGKASMKYQTTFLKNYKPASFLIKEAKLEFNLDPDETLVKSKLSIYRNSATHKIDDELRLDGINLDLQSIRLNQELLSPETYELTDQELIIKKVTEKFELEIEVKIYPRTNFSCSGLYLTQGDFCTQNEPHGFRSITYFIDRPDIMTHFTTSIVADRNQYPVLLSNGNLIHSESVTDNRHKAVWQDPFPKPAYLFALVAGQFDVLEDIYFTKSGKNIRLKIFSKPKYLGQCLHAMQSLKQAMSWEEKNFGLEYDLDLYQIVGIDDFNFGAMENKGLNIFNHKVLLASKETATDNDFKNVASVIAHEYFHNWTGNRVGCRDWFQVGLKEGLTTLREALFTEDHYGKIGARISSIKFLYDRQFVEDAGPLAHPIRLDSYIEVDNFYTTTVYQKSAEVARMLFILFGQEGFSKILSTFLNEFDGKSATIEDFLNIAANVTDNDLKQFKSWYIQSGTPTLHINDGIDTDTQFYYLDIAQYHPQAKEDFYIPFSLGLINPQGKNFFTQILIVDKNQQRFHLTKVEEKPILIPLQQFSAPIKVNYSHNIDELLHISLHSQDPISKWEAGQKLLSSAVLNIYNSNDDFPSLSSQSFDLFEKILNDKNIDKALAANILSFPTIAQLMDNLREVDVKKLYQSIEFAKYELATKLHSNFINCYHEHNINKPYEVDAQSIATRAIKNIALQYISIVDDKNLFLAIKQLEKADNLTDQYTTLVSIANSSHPEREKILNNYYRKWKDHPNLFNKWLVLNASSKQSGYLERIEQITSYPEFDQKNPNNIYALIRTFATDNPIHFHADDGSGYKFLSKWISSLDQFNYQLAATLARFLTNSTKLESKLRDLIRQEIIYMSNITTLSPNLYEIISKALEEVASYE